MPHVLVSSGHSIPQATTAMIATVNAFRIAGAMIAAKHDVPSNSTHATPNDNSIVGGRAARRPFGRHRRGGQVHRRLEVASASHIAFIGIRMVSPVLTRLSQRFPWSS